MIFFFRRNNAQNSSHKHTHAYMHKGYEEKEGKLHGLDALKRARDSFNKIFFSMCEGGFLPACH